MTVSCEIFLLGTDQPSTTSPVASSFTPVPNLTLAAASADNFRQLASESPADYLGFVDSALTLTEAAAQSCQTSSSTGRDVVVFAGLDQRQQPTAWQLFPPRLASLVSRPETEALLFVRRDTLLADNALRDVPCPLWDLTIRLQAGEASSTRVVCQQLADLQRDKRDYPSLAPAEPSRQVRWLLEHLRQFHPRELQREIASTADSHAITAGLLQIHDYLDESHRVSQSIEGEGLHAAGDYWHAIMHRREPDYSNAKYWFRRVGRHPIFDKLAQQADAFLTGCDDPDSDRWRQRLMPDGRWDSFAFVDFCAEASRVGSQSMMTAATAIQWREMLLLLDSTLHDALGEF